jgi:hypothetical protein
MKSRIQESEFRIQDAPGAKQGEDEQQREQHGGLGHCSFEIDRT